MRAQSEVIGVVILLGISVTAIGMILFFGQPAIGNGEENAQFDRMENEFSLIDSRISTSVLGASESQSVRLNVNNGKLESDPDASWMKVVYKDAGGNTTEIANVMMGNVRYVQGDRTLAYEGGGVWKSKVGEDYTRMVATPEFHYRGSTLTLPAYNITSREIVSGSAHSLFMESDENPDLKFPNQNLDNPLEQGNVTIIVKSEYYRGWESFFRSRTTGAVESVNEAEQKVRFSLEVPKELFLNAGVEYIPGGGADTQGGSTVESTDEIEINLPDADSIIQPELNKCFPNPDSEPNCVDLTNVSGDLDENKIYYVNGTGEYTMGDHNAPNANVTILVNRDLEYKNNFDVGTDNAERVEVYVDGDLDLQGGEINTDPNTGNETMFITYITGEIKGSPGAGGIDYTGVIYAPNTDHGGCSGGGPGGGGGPGTNDQKIAGGANITGAVIATSVCVQGGSEINFGDELELLDLTPDVSLIRYLHVTENKIRLSS